MTADHVRPLELTGGVFETIRITAGEPFVPERHAQRLAVSSAALFGTEIDVDRVVTLIVNEARRQRDNGEPNGFLRLTAVADDDGSIDLVVGFRRGEPRTDVLTLVSLPTPFAVPASVVGHKATAYAPNRIAFAAAQAAGADEAVLVTPDGVVCESTSATIVIEMRGRLVTPSLDAGCLPGIARSLLLEFELVTEAAIPATALTDATEAFLLSTGRMFQPIATLDGRQLAGAPGPLTDAARRSWIRAIGR